MDQNYSIKKMGIDYVHMGFKKSFIMVRKIDPFGSISGKEILHIHFFLPVSFKFSDLSSLLFTQHLEIYPRNLPKMPFLRFGFAKSASSSSISWIVGPIPLFEYTTSSSYRAAAPRRPRVLLGLKQFLMIGESSLTN